MFTGAKFCPHCGAPGQSFVPQGTKLPCPRCGTNLQSITAANIPLDECPHCGGLWISVAAFDLVCSNTAAQSAATGLNLPPPIPPDGRVRYLHCPKCSNLMNRVNYGHASGIIINICKPDGVWLDRDEMSQIVAFLRAGGMEKIHQTEEAQLRDEQQEKREELRTGALNAEYLPTDLSEEVTPLSSFTMWSPGTGAAQEVLDLINSLLWHIRK